ncbi:pilus assembly protein PilZ [Candidatus Pelagibacter sp.]|nr:pilus assembly protein PilZ [Candidatus Pelagibacter sp.]
MIKNKQKGFALVLSLILLLAMSLMGGALIVIASSDHQGNNSSDEYQQTFYVAETALMEAEKSLVNKMIGPINNVSGIRDFSGRFIPRNQELTDPAPNQTPCYRSFRNLSRDVNFRVVEQLENQSFFSLIEPIFDDQNFALVPTIDTTNAIDDEKEKLNKFRYEFFSVNSGTAAYKAAGISLKKTSGANQRLGTAYRVYGCGMMGDVQNPEIIIPLETIVILSH